MEIAENVNTNFLSEVVVHFLNTEILELPNQTTEVHHILIKVVYAYEGAS